MSLSGNDYYSGQNLENTNPLESINLEFDVIRSDIAQNEIDMDENATKISTLQTQGADISYNLATDTTTISNRLKIVL